MGQIWVSVLPPNPDSELIGLSKYARICDWIMSRPQIQEEAITMLADELEQRVRPEGLAVVMQASHFCMHWRGVKAGRSLMKNSIMRGTFLKDASLRSEFLSLVKSANPS
jgi:GTP cyclohydrolase I